MYFTLLFVGCAYSIHSSEFESTDEFDGEEYGFQARNDLDPIILIPGLAGSRIEYKNKTGTKWDTLWLDILRTVPGRLTSYMKDLKVTFDPDTETYTSASHIETRPADYGGTTGVTYLDPTLKIVSGMFNKIVESLIDTGYKAGENLFGAPFDWRLANAKQVKENGMFANLKLLVEQAYSLNNKKVHILGHSCGCIFTRLFLAEYVPSAWKDKHIASFISVSGPYSGSPEAFAHLAAPRKWAIPTLSANETHEMVADFGGIHWMIPNDNGYSSDYVIARVPSRNQVFTIKNMSLAFSTTNRLKKQKAIEMTTKHVKGLAAPGVPVHLIYSHNVSTVSELIYNGPAVSWWKETSTDIEGDGDGTVPLISLTAPVERWPREDPKNPMRVIKIKGKSHTKILDDKTFLQEVVDIVSRNK